MNIFKRLLPTNRRQKISLQGNKGITGENGSCFSLTAGDFGDSFFEETLTDNAYLINAKIERGQFFVCEKCTGILSEIWDYCRGEAGQIVKVNDHFLDALRYAVFSDIQQGVILA